MDKIPKIERGIPPPKPRKTGASALLRSMKVGESVVFPGGKAISVRTTLNRFGPLKFTTCTLENGDVRIWRIA